MAKQAFCFQTPVRFSDVDHAGIVYFPTFFHYFHLAFEEFVRERIGVSAYRKLLDEDRIGFPIVHAESDFHQPLRFGDLIDIEMLVTKLGDRSIHFKFALYRIENGRIQTADDSAPNQRELVAEGRMICAVVDFSKFRSTPLPIELRSIFSRIKV